MTEAALQQLANEVEWDMVAEKHERLLGFNRTQQIVALETWVPDLRMREMILDFDWDRAFDMKYFVEFFDAHGG